MMRLQHSNAFRVEFEEDMVLAMGLALATPTPIPEELNPETSLDVLSPVKITATKLRW